MYRSFTPLISFKNDGIKTPIEIEDVECKIGIPYISYNNGKVLFKENGIFKTPKYITYRSKIYNNEVGCYNEKGYNKNDKEVLRIKYYIEPKLLEKYNYDYNIFTLNHPKIKKFSYENLENGVFNEKTGIVSNSYLRVNLKNGEIFARTEKDLFSLIFSIEFLFLSITWILWYLFGRDKYVMVPEYLHYKPKLKYIGDDEY
jgi:hypothetical protein